LLVSHRTSLIFGIARTVSVTLRSTRFLCLLRHWRVRIIFISHLSLCSLASRFMLGILACYWIVFHWLFLHHQVMFRSVFCLYLAPSELRNAFLKSEKLIQILVSYRHGNPKTLTIKQILVHFFIHSLMHCVVENDSIVSNNIKLVRRRN
jgi:hypothetical protein